MANPRPPVEITDNGVQNALSPLLSNWYAPCLVMLDHAVGYLFTVWEDENTDGQLFMSKTSDGGITWSHTGMWDTPGSFDLYRPVVWYEGWTPNAAGTGFGIGTKIHIFVGNTNGGGARYTYLDTANDTFKSGANSGLGAADLTNITLLRYQGKTARPSMTQSSNGDLHFVGADLGCDWWISTDGGDTWTQQTRPFAATDSTVDDMQVVAMGDNHLCFIFWAVGSDEIFYRVRNHGTGSWDNSATSISAGYEGTAASGGLIDNAPYHAIWTPNDAYGDERVLLSIAVDAIATANDHHLDFWEYDVSGNTWAQGTDIHQNTGSEYVGCSTLSYITDNGNIGCTYYRSTTSAIAGGLYYRDSADDGVTWSAETSLNANTIINCGPKAMPYTQSTAGNVAISYADADDLTLWVVNADVFYPFPITSDYSAVAYAGVTTDWTIDMDGPTSKGLEALSGGIGVKWQNQISPYSAGFYKTIDTLDISGKIMLIDGEVIVPSAIGNAAQGGLRVRLVDSNDLYGEWFIGGSDTLSGAETLLVAGDSVPDTEGTIGPTPLYRSYTVQTETTSSTIAVTHPANMEDGDVVLIYVMSDSATNGITSWPTGFATATGTDVGDQNDDGHSIAVGYKVITNAAGEGTWTVTLDDTAALKAFGLCYDNVNNSDPIGEVDYALNADEGPLPDINSDYGGAAHVLAVLDAGTHDQVNAPPDGYNEIDENLSNSMLSWIGDATVGGGVANAGIIDLKNGQATDDQLVMQVILNPDYGFDKTDCVKLAFYYRTNSPDGGKNDPPWVFKTMKAGSFIRVRGGTSGSPMEADDIRAWDAFFNLGLIQRSGNNFRVSAQLYIGDSAASDTYDTYFTDTNKTFVIPPSGVGDDFLFVTFDGSANTTTEIRLGENVGTIPAPVGARGCTFDSAPDRFGAQDKLTVNVLNDNIDLLELYGCKFLDGKVVNFGSAVSPISTADVRVVDCAFDKYEEVVRKITGSTLTWVRNQIPGEIVSGIGLTLLDDPVVDLDNTSVYSCFDGVKLTVLANITFDGVTFSSNVTDVFNDSGGHVTITITNGGSYPSVRNGTGATTTVENPVVLTIKSVPTGAEWRLYEKSATQGQIGTVELDGAESHAGGDISYNYTYTADTDAALQIMADGKVERLILFVLSASDQIITVELEPETNE